MGITDNAEIIRVEIDEIADDPKRGVATHTEFERLIHVPGCVPGEIVKVILFDEGPQLMGFLWNSLPSGLRRISRWERY